MNTQITIEVPEDKVAKQITNPDGSISITFVDKEPIRSKSWEEFCKNYPDAGNEFYINGYGGIISSVKHSDRTSEQCNSYLSSKEDAEAVLALIQLTRLHDEWVGNWKPDYSAQDEVKYQIKFSLNEINVASHYIESSLLNFPTKEMALEFLNWFEDLIIKAKKFI